MAGKDRQRIFGVVAIAVVEREGGERLHCLRGEAGGHFGKRNKLVTLGSQALDRLSKKIGRHFQMAARLKGARLLRPDMVEREDCAAAARIRHHSGTRQCRGHVETARHQSVSDVAAPECLKSRFRIPHYDHAHVTRMWVTLLVTG